MQGYYKLPEATKEMLDDEGWLHTGDIGELDSDGYLKITDRKKELLKTAGGKYIAPQPIEGMIKRNKFVANAVLYGDRRKYPIALVVPNFDNLERWAKERNLSYGSLTPTLKVKRRVVEKRDQDQIDAVYAAGDAMAAAIEG
jgi:long-chain acyl-CoA synthetase